MSLLIKNATILDPDSSHNGKRLDLFIKKDKIVAIGRNLKEKAAKTLSGKSLYVSPGWVDVMADYCDPGFEHKESIESGLQAAAAGGFSDVFVVPNTKPTITTRSVLEYVRKKAVHEQVNLHVIGAVSKNIEGKDLAEMMDMQHAGAIAFSDGWKPVQDAGLMLKALEYVKAFKGVIMQLPVEEALASGGLMHEGELSVRMGMSGIPSIAEALLVYRDIELLRYTQSRLHISGVSTLAALDLIRKAKKEGLDITCSVTPYHLMFTADVLEKYESVFKVSPPLRTEVERKALIKAILDGTIDCIATHHRPQDWDAKVKEFEYAQYGMIGQETCLPMLLAAAPQVPVERWVRLLSYNPRQVFGLPPVAIETGNTTPLTIFDTEEEWLYELDNKRSLGINTPWMGKKLKGKVLN